MAKIGLSIPTLEMLPTPTGSFFQLKFIAVTFAKQPQQSLSKQRLIVMFYSEVDLSFK